MVLYWLRNCTNSKIVGELFDVSTSTVIRDVYQTLPLLCNILKNTNALVWPDDWSEVTPGFGGAQFIMDCTSHFCKRVRPSQHLYYKGDKYAHFLTAQVTVSMTGIPYDVQIGLGHNNDKRMFNLTTREYVEEESLTGLTDREYQHVNLLRPDDVEVAQSLHFNSIDEFSSAHSVARSLGEIINAIVKNWEFASGVCSQPPELQAISLMIIYYLVTLKKISK